MISIDQLNRMSEEDFIDTLGGVYEHSAWVAEASLSFRPFPDKKTLIACMHKIVDAAEVDQKIRLLKSHPDLAGKLAIEGNLTKASKSEQASLGLDRLSPGDFSELNKLNQRYHQRFEFPFIVCVRLLRDIPDLLVQFRKRIEHDPATERAEAIRQVHAIARLRIEDLVD